MILRISPVFCLVLALVAFAQIQASAAPNDDEEEGTQWFKLVILRRKFKKGQVGIFFELFDFKCLLDFDNLIEY